jgi:hypothetical protein
MPQEPWIKPDRRYKTGYRWTPHAYRTVFRWAGVIFLWLLLSSVFGTFRVPFVPLIPTFGLIWYSVHRYRISNRARAVVPPGYVPPPLPPEDAQYGVWGQNGEPYVSHNAASQANAPVGERNSRVIPQAVKIAVSARDGGRCRQCGSTEELHFDHVIPWSKGGANTVNNIQLLCGPCNRRKGADDIPAGW